MAERLELNGRLGGAGLDDVGGDPDGLVVEGWEQPRQIRRREAQPTPAQPTTPTHLHQPNIDRLNYIDSFLRLLLF